MNAACGVVEAVSGTGLGGKSFLAVVAWVAPALAALGRAGLRAQTFEGAARDVVAA